MDSSIISGLFGGLLAVLIGYFVVRRNENVYSDGQLYFGKSLVFLGIGCLLISIFAFTAFFFDEDVWQDPSEFWSAVGLLIGFGVAAIYSFGEALKVRGKFDEHGIYFTTPWTGEKQEKWQDLESVECNGITNWYLLTFKSGKKIRLSFYLIGLTQALTILEEKDFIDED